jgi:hypothetical protein
MEETDDALNVRGQSSEALYYCEVVDNSWSMEVSCEGPHQPFRKSGSMRDWYPSDIYRLVPRVSALREKKPLVKYSRVTVLRRRSKPRWRSGSDPSPPDPISGRGRFYLSLLDAKAPPEVGPKAGLRNVSCGPCGSPRGASWHTNGGP